MKVWRTIPLTGGGFNKLTGKLGLFSKQQTKSFPYMDEFICWLVAVGIGLAGSAFACMRMPLRATNSTQVLFV
jgi:hypothetical protein